MSSITTPPRATSRRGLAMGILIFASFMDLLDVTIVQVALPTIREDLGATPAQLEWIVSGYMLAFAVVLITGGRLGDIVGRQRTFLIGVAGFTLASVVASLSATGDLLVAARVVQGAFAALMVPQGLSTLQALYTPKERAPMYGIIGGVSGLAAVIGPVLGGWLVSADIAGLGWRSIFLLNVPIGIAIFALAARYVPNTKSPNPLRLDILGVVLLSGALLGMLFLNKLPRLHHPLLKNRRFALATHDRYFVVIETSDPKYSETETRKLLETVGSKQIEMVED